MSEQIQSCALCGRSCHAMRDSQTGKGYCGCGALMQVCLAKPHYGEEPCLSGRRGSGAIFFGGCGLGCVFCQNRQISAAPSGKYISPVRLSEIFQELEQRGVHNINLVNPTQYVYQIAEAITLYKPKIPVVYNSSGYDSAEALDCMKGLIDIFLPDFKFFTSSRAERYMHAPNYSYVAQKALLQMHEQQPQNLFDAEGMMKKGLIIRHLVLPCNLDETRKVLMWIAEQLGTETIVSLMGQYVPMGEVCNERYAEINRVLTAREYHTAQKLLLDLGFKNGFFQRRSSAEEEWVPIFNLEGV